MDINGVHVIPEPSDTTEDGFVTTIHRDGSIRGPFPTIQEAIAAAQKWADEPTVAPSIAVETKSESVAIQVEKPVENPPVIELEKVSETK